MLANLPVKHRVSRMSWWGAQDKEDDAALPSFLFVQGHALGSALFILYTLLLERGKDRHWQCKFISVSVCGKMKASLRSH